MIKAFNSSVELVMRTAVSKCNSRFVKDLNMKKQN